MATLSSSSTLTAVQNAYDDNASYVEDNSTAKAIQFQTACRILLRRMPKLASHGGNQLQNSVDEIEKQLQIATDWIDAGGGISTTTRRGNRNFARLGGRS